MRESDLVQRWLPVLAAFLLGVGLVSGVGVAHDGSGQLLHSGHSDTMNGTLTAKGFKYNSPKTQKLVLGASSFNPNAHTCQFTLEGYGGALKDLNGCAGYSQDFSLPKGSRITKVTW